MAGCEFDRELEMDKYVENKAAYGERFARQYLKTNMAHYRAKEAGQDVPPWDVYLTEKGLTTEDGKELLELTEQPLTSHLSAHVSNDIKSRVPVEMETVRHANALAFSGADTIFMPEHVSDSRGIFVRFVTKYKKDSIDPNKYQGSQIDLGKDMLPEEAKIKMQDMMGGSDVIRSLQSNKYKDAFAFALHEKTNIREDVVQNRDKTTHEIDKFTDRDTEGKFVELDRAHGIAVLPRDPTMHTEEKIDLSVLERAKNMTHKTNLVGDVVNDGVKIGHKVAVDTKTTLVSAGLFALEALKKRKKTDESKQAVPLADKIRSVFVHKKEQFDEFRNRRLKEILHHVDYRIRESGKRFAARVVSRWHEMMAVQSMFAFVAESGVGIGVALLGLRFMTRELPEMPKKTQLENRFLKDHAPKNLEEREKVQRPKRSRAFHRLIPSVDKITLKRYFVKKEKRGVTVLLPVADALKRRFLKKHEARVALKEKNVRAAKPVERLWKTLHLWTRRLERLKAPSRRSVFREHTTADQKSVRESVSIRFVPFRQELRRIDLKAIEKRRQETVLHFSFAWTLWSLFTLSHADGVQGAISTIELNTDRKASGQETITEAEAPQWILLGIIWYLSMMRESGFGNNTPAGQYVSPPNPAPQYLVPQGVIFAYAPVPEHSSVRGFAHNAHIMI